ncbi:hypothetical protein CAP48_00470 [Advenella sp. S44]|uniref:hypothetical protein n=1 Tax=Advenella sp. S44 TaxID=1982755 RepID=UPI000C2A1DB0|nr:hypothetical protein [Advenella sp. S44]PJX27706.1 hypothetical protein CAP48_00470 [Advenella sp. S44]
MDTNAGLPKKAIADYSAESTKKKGIPGYTATGYPNREIVNLSFCASGDLHGNNRHPGRPMASQYLLVGWLRRPIFRSNDAPKNHRPGRTMDQNTISAAVRKHQKRKRLTNTTTVYKKTLYVK